jgi:hypothetical protein
VDGSDKAAEGTRLGEGKNIKPLLCPVSGLPFYNTTRFTFTVTLNSYLLTLDHSSLLQRSPAMRNIAETMAINSSRILASPPPQ